MHVSVCCVVGVFSLPPVVANTVSHHHEVMEQGLTPVLARRACGNDRVIPLILSREIAKAVAARSDAIIAQRRAADGLVALSGGAAAAGGKGKGRGEGEGNGNDRGAAARVPF